ncbi:MAG: sulfatase [Gemmatimonadetes bacterium]|nr:sulfatase [Gemmatimonadota bacterium]
MNAAATAPTHPTDPAPSRVSWWTPVAAAIVLGTIAGAAHVGLAWGRGALQDRFTWTSRDLAWMSPLGHIAMFVGPALVVSLLIALGWRRGARFAGFAVPCVMAVTTLALHVTGLHPYAVAALGIGGGVRLAQWAMHGAAAARWGRRLAVAAACCCAVLWLLAMRRPGDRGAIAGDVPNVLVLVWDTVRAASTSLHGYARPTTPTLDAMAREGLTFGLAISPSSWTLPSHGAMFTGQPAGRLSSSWRRPLDATYPTVAEALGRAGYRTGAFVGNLFYTHHESGVDRGFATLRDFRRSPRQLFWSTALGQTRLATRLAWGRGPGDWWAALRDFELRLKAEPFSDRRRADEITSEFLDWQARSSTPFFAFLNLYDAHDPYEPPAGYDTLFARPQSRQDAYDAGIRYMDDQLRRLLDALRQRGVLDRTLVIVTSDHGEQWGEHGLHNHGNSLYLPAVHVPLVMRWPGNFPTGRIEEPVSLTDVAATIAAAARLPAGSFPGQPLPAGGRGIVVTETEALDPSVRAKSPAEHGALAALFQDSLQYFRNGDTTYQLFDIRKDPAQLNDLIATPEGCRRAIDLDARLRGVTAMPATPPFTSARCAVAGGAP